MRFTIILLTIVACVACAPKEHEAPSPGLSIASIPNGCTLMDHPYGTHQFGPEEFLMVNGYDCGTREGKLCSYFVHSPDFMENSFKYATLCEAP